MEACMQSPYATLLYSTGMQWMGPAYRNAAGDDGVEDACR